MAKQSQMTTQKENVKNGTFRDTNTGKRLSPKDAFTLAMRVFDCECKQLKAHCSYAHLNNRERLAKLNVIDMTAAHAITVGRQLSS